MLRAARPIAFAAVAVACAWYWRRRRRLKSAALAVPMPAHARPAVDRPRSRWRLDDLPSLRHSDGYLVVYKQHDLHMDHAEEAVTLMTQLNAKHADLADPRTAFGFRHVHQLDYATSGVLLVALSKRAAGAASRLFEKRLVRKLYLALVDGHADWDAAHHDGAVGEDSTDPRGFRMALAGDAGCGPAQPARTELLVVARGWLGDRPVTKLLLHPISGRRHQLRLHCRAVGHAVVGDVAYAGDEAARRMALHAWRLEVPLRPRDGRPVCVATADPFPVLSDPSAAASPLDPPHLWELPPTDGEGGSFDPQTALAELQRAAADADATSRLPPAELVRRGPARGAALAMRVPE